MSRRDPDAPEHAALLAALGLTANQAAVLAVVADEGDTTTAHSAARLGLSRPQVSAALQALEEHGLVERLRGVRPQPVSLAADADIAVADLLRQRQQERDKDAERTAEAAALLRRAVQERAQRPQLDLRRLVGGAANADYLRGQVSVDEVARPGGATVQYGGHLAANRGRKRLLVLGQVPAERAAWLEHKGVDVRTTSAVLPVLAVVDGERACVETAGTGPGRSAWTFDAAQVGALQRLFDLWWEESQAVL